MRSTGRRKDRTIGATPYSPATHSITHTHILYICIYKQLYIDTFSLSLSYHRFESLFFGPTEVSLTCPIHVWVLLITPLQSYLVYPERPLLCDDVLNRVPRIAVGQWVILLVLVFGGGALRLPFFKGSKFQMSNFKKWLATKKTRGF